MRVALSLLLLVLLATPAAAKEQTFTITAKESGCPEGAPYCFEPASVFVSVGDVVTLAYADVPTNFMPHNLHVLGDVDQRTELRDPGAARSDDKVTFTAKAGEVPFRCDAHPQMTGVVRVESETTGSSRTPAAALPLVALALVVAAFFARRAA